MSLYESYQENRRKVLMVPRWAIPLSAPLFRRSLPHRGRVLRFGLHRMGPVLRDHFGTY
jgi:hypothetical protein